MGKFTKYIRFTKDPSNKKGRADALELHVTGTKGEVHITALSDEKLQGWANMQFITVAEDGTRTYEYIWADDVLKMMDRGISIGDMIRESLYPKGE